MAAQEGDVSASWVLPPDERSYYERHYEEIDDLVLMEGEAEVPEIAGVLSSRYQNGNIYTSVGPVLIASNPYKILTTDTASGDKRSIYDDLVAMHYFRTDAQELGPHIFGVGAAAYKNLTVKGTNQCVIVTGESGAGKTEAAKQLMQFVTVACTDTSAAKQSKSQIRKKRAKTTAAKQAVPTNAPSRSQPVEARVARALTRVASTANVNSELAKRAKRKQLKGGGLRKPMKAGGGGGGGAKAEPIDEGVQEAFDELKDASGKVTLATATGLDDFQGPIDENIITRSFLDQLAAEVAKIGGAQTLTVQGFQKLLKAVEAEITFVTEEDVKLAQQAQNVAGAASGGRRASASSFVTMASGIRENEEDALGTSTSNPLQMRELEDVKEQLLQSNPVLEAFGNAKTIRNNNSSRFGKYMELQFMRTGKVIGGKVTSYLLEKARVIYQSPGERSFHIFYALLMGADDQTRDRLQLASPESYRYLMNEARTVEGMDDAEHFEELEEAMQTIGMTDDEKRELSLVLAFILSLGNLEFTEQPVEGAADQTQVVPTDGERLRATAALLQVEPDDIIRALSTHVLKGIGKRTSITVQHLDVAATTNNRDTLAKEVFKRVFDFVVDRVNSQINYQGRDTLLMGVLDIYGFEIFEENSLEQFLINYVNESLQQYFIELTLKTEQEEYEREGIPWEQVQYFDNAPVVSLIEAKNASIFSVLNEQANFKSANTKTLLDAMKSQISNVQFVPPGTLSLKHTAFGVKHYAGQVEYNAELFMIKNADTMYDDLKQLMAHSPCRLSKDLFASELGEGVHRKRPPSIVTQFKTQINQLVKTLQQCTPHYCRCVKPNDEKQSLVVNMERMTHQVQYLNVRENVMVRRAGFCFRMPYGLFVSRFKAVCRHTWMAPADADVQELTRQMLTSGDAAVWPSGALHLDALTEGEDFKMGSSKVFIKHPNTIFLLESQRQASIPSVAALIQKIVRGKVWRGLFLKQRAGFIKTQAAIRTTLATLRFQKTLYSIEVTQSMVRKFVANCRTAKFKQQFKNKPPRLYAIKVQAKYRSLQARNALAPDVREQLRTAGERIKEARARYNATTAIGAMWRQRQQRKEYQKIKRCVQRVENRLRVLLSKIRYEKLRREEFEAAANVLRTTGMPITKYSHRRNPLTGTSVHTSNHTFKLVDDDTKLVWLGGGLMSKGKSGMLLTDLTRLERGLNPELSSQNSAEDFGDVTQHFSLQFKDDKMIFLRAQSEWERERLFRVFSRLNHKEY